MTRPDLDAVLQPLKGFQRKTVDHAFDRLFLAPDSTARFLVADEVGLGKTLVARGIIARTIDHLWDTVGRIDIVYICSNASIARQNLSKLHIAGGSERSFALATRLTMLATELAPAEGRASLADSKVNFVSFTPGTSFDMGRSGGRWREREVLFHILRPHVESWTALANLMQGNLERRRWWRERLRAEEVPIEEGIRADFDRAYQNDQQLQEQVAEALSRFRRYREPWPRDARALRNRTIGALRAMLAGVCLRALEADLVILDEFQRFRHLLGRDADQDDPAVALAHALFDTVTPEEQPVRTLLLSATPYKLYTADAEIEHEDHYEDFLATSSFLMKHDEARANELKGCLVRFGASLKRAASGASADVVGARTDVERQLRQIMARTERVAATESRDAMVYEPKLNPTISAGDVQQYMAADALFRAVGDRDPMPFWKSAPYLAHFMRGYRFDERLAETLGISPKRVAQVLHRHGGAFLDAERVARFEALDPNHAKLRALLASVEDTWQLLWMPPTVPYWPAEGPYRGVGAPTKSLLFSAWNVVPDVVSGLISYEVERRMSNRRLARYAEPTKQQRQLLRLAATDRRASHRLLLLLLPCLTLADEAHPLRAQASSDRVAYTRARVEALLARLPDPQGPEDGRWVWGLPVLLDPALRAHLAAWRDDRDRERPNPEAFDAYIQDLIDLQPGDLGGRPANLRELAVDVALGSPAVIAARTLAMAAVDADTRRRLSIDIAMAFWSLFNRPSVITMLRGLAQDDHAYWHAVLRYCRAGNLQAVLDESWHLLWEQHAWGEATGAGDIAEAAAEQLAGAIQPKVSRVHARFFRAAANGHVARQEIRLRTDLALRFGTVRGNDEQQISQDQVRAAFNSPFRPFILATTSVGQEGLDFHPWCHRLVHWDLPGNPVDLEQREGRVHRYKGHAVRKNAAAAHADSALAAWRPGRDLWQHIFSQALTAARARGDSDLVPYWLCPGDHRVERHVPLLPWTRETEMFARLKRQLAAYRVVFGQPRQEELLRLLDSSAVDIETLQSWSIDLRPQG